MIRRWLERLALRGLVLGTKPGVHIRRHHERTPEDYKLTRAEVDAIMDQVVELVGWYSQDTMIGGSLKTGKFEIEFPMRSP